MKKDYLLLAVPTPGSDLPEVVRATVPENMTRWDLYVTILASVPADAPQPVPLNLDDDLTTNMAG